MSEVPVCCSFEHFQAATKYHKDPFGLEYWETKSAKSLLKIVAAICHRDGLVMEEVAGEILREGG